MAKNSKYWQERYDQIEQAANNKSVRYTSKLEKKYRTAASEIDAQINKWYNRIAKNNNISMTEARRLLSADELKEFRWTVEEYIERGRENAISQQWMKELENASAKFHISRLEAMKLECRHQIEMAMASGQQDMFDMLSDVYKDTFYRSAYELQKGVSIGFDVAKLDDNLVSSIINRPWAADGTNFSDKIWRNKTKLLNTLDQEITRMVLTGDTPNHAVTAIKEAMNSSLFQAKRLVFTEQAYFTSEAQKKCFNSLDVEEFEVISCADMKVCDRCAEHDAKHHPMSEFHIGITAPPFHPLCRCVTAPYFNDEFTTPTRWVKGIDGEKYEIPANMNYGEWKKTFVDGGSKEEFVEIKNPFNFKVQRGKHTMESDIAKVNPKYSTGGRMYTNNCGYCSFTTEMRRRGFDVEANGLDGMYLRDWQKAFADFKPLTVSAKRKAQAIEEMKQTILSWGDGARGGIFGVWDGRRWGHYFNFEVSENKVFFIDGQNGKIEVEKYLSEMKPSSIVYGRWDNLDPTETVKKACKDCE